MWPFEDAPKYVNDNGDSAAAGSGLSRRTCWTWGIQPSYVDPSGSSTCDGTFPPITKELFSPELNDEPTAYGTPLLVDPPAGAKRYRLWVSTAKPVDGRPPDAPPDAVMTGLGVADEGAVAGQPLSITPRWAWIGLHPLPAGALKATLLVTFE